MKYYVIQTCKNFVHSPKLIGWFGKINPQHLTREKLDQISDNIILKTHPTPDLVFTDVISFPIFMVSQTVKHVFELFEPSLPIKRVILFDDLNGASQPYYIPAFKKLECLSDGSRYNPDKSILHHGVLDRSTVADTPFFKLGGLKNTYIVVRLDVAECILRRNPRGIDFEELTVTNKGCE